MKTDLLEKLLDELGITPITENNVRFAMKKAINNPIYWFFFKRKKLADNINFVTSILSIVCITALLFAGAFISTTPFSDKFISNHLGLYLIFGFCLTLVVAIVSRAISVEIASWNIKTGQYMWGFWNLIGPLKETLEKLKGVLDYNSEYYREGVRLSGQHVNKTRFVFVEDKRGNRYCINISAIETE